MRVVTEKTDTADDAISIPLPPKPLATAVDYLVHQVGQTHGFKHGRTAFFWHLVSVVNAHTIVPVETTPGLASTTRGERA